MLRNGGTVVSDESHGGVTIVTGREWRTRSPQAAVPRRAVTGVAQRAPPTHWGRPRLVGSGSSSTHALSRAGSAGSRSRPCTCVPSN